MSQPTDHCPLCGAARRPKAPTCHVCDTDLNKTPEPMPGRVKRERFTRRRLLFVAAAILVAIPLLIVGDLLLAPRSVSRTRSAFRATPTSLVIPPSLEIATAPAEDVVAFFRSHLRLNATAYRDIAIYPIERDGERRIIISRREHSRSPLHVILSVEVALDPKLHVIVVRRGLRHVSDDLAHVYFGRELQALEACDNRP